MKKKFIGALVIILSLSTVQVSAIDTSNKDYLKNVVEDNNISRSDGKTKVMYDNEIETPRFIEGKLSKTKVKDKNEALKYLNENMNAFNLKNGEFKFESEEKEDEFAHYKFQYYLNGIEVYGSELIVHTDKDNIVYAVNGQAEPNIPTKDFSKEFKIDEEKAINNGFEYMKTSRKSGSKPEVKKYIKKINNEWKSVYNFKIVLEMKIFEISVDANNGLVLEKECLNNNVHADGEGIDIDGNTRKLNLDYKDNKYYFRDVTHKGVVETCYGEKSDKFFEEINSAQTLEELVAVLENYKLVESDTNKFEDKERASVVDAHSNLSEIVNYYKENFDRDGFDGNGAKIKAITDVGSELNNAMSLSSPEIESSYLIFGHSNEANYARALDVIAHEYTHSIAGTTAKFAGGDQAGALNESFADIFGCLIENDSKDIKDEAYWEIGEDISLTGEGGQIRSLDNPTKYGNPDNMKDYYIGGIDNGGVHINSTINSKALCNIAKEIGRDDAQKIYYRALTKYLFSNATFIDAKYAVNQAAKDEFGDKYVDIINEAYNSVGIKDMEPDKNVLALPKVIGDVDETVVDPTFGKVDCDFSTGNFDIDIIVDKDNAAKRIYIEELYTPDFINQNVNVLLDEEIDTSKKEFTKKFSFKDKKPGIYDYIVTIQSNNGFVRVLKEVIVLDSFEGLAAKWENSREYKEGEAVVYKDHMYECISSHTSQESWMPATSPSLWKKLF